MQLEKAIKSRKSVRRFSDKKPDWRKIVRAIDAARFSPMAGNYYSVRFVLVDNPEKIKTIATACQQDFVKDAQYVLVVVSETEKVKKLYNNGENFAQQQAGAAIENVWLALTSAGISTCWVETFVEDEIKRVIFLPEGYDIVAIFPLGMETKIKTNPKSRPDLETILFYNKYGNKKMLPETIVTNESN